MIGSLDFDEMGSLKAFLEIPDSVLPYRNSIYSNEIIKMAERKSGKSMYSILEFTWVKVQIRQISFVIEDE